MCVVVPQTCKDDETSTVACRMPGCNQSNILTKGTYGQVVIEKASEQVGQKFDHCVVTFFQNKNDLPVMHYDTVLDLGKDSSILSISFGYGAMPLLVS
jgi:hypothetical protein